MGCRFIIALSTFSIFKRFLQINFSAVITFLHCAIEMHLIPGFYLIFIISDTVFVVKTVLLLIIIKQSRYEFNTDVVLYLNC